MGRMEHRLDRMKIQESYAYERMRMIIPYGHTHTYCEDPIHHPYSGYTDADNVHHACVLYLNGRAHHWPSPFRS